MYKVVRPYTARCIGIGLGTVFLFGGKVEALGEGGRSKGRDFFFNPRT